MRPVTGESTGAAIDTRIRRLRFRCIRNEPHLQAPHPDVPPEHEREKENQTGDVLDAAFDVIEGVVESAIDGAGSCFDVLPDFDCAIVDCDPGCA